MTGTAIETPGRIFVLREIRSIRRVETFTHAARKVALICSAAELVLATVAAVRYGAAALVGGGLTAAVTMAVAVLIDGRNNPRRMELHCTYRGEQVMLYSSSEQRTFEAVRRAVLRAAESISPDDV